MEIWNIDSLETGNAHLDHRRRPKVLEALLSAAFRLRASSPIRTVRLHKAIRSLHAECDQLRQRMDRVR